MDPWYQLISGLCARFWEEQTYGIGQYQMQQIVLPRADG